MLNKNKSAKLSACAKPSAVKRRNGFLTCGLTMANDVDCLHYPKI
jgi:hypothetical protein